MSEEKFAKVREFVEVEWVLPARQSSDSGRGPERGSGVEIDTELYRQVVTFRDGRNGADRVLRRVGRGPPGRWAVRVVMAQEGAAIVRRVFDVFVANDFARARVSWLRGGMNAREAMAGG